MDARTGALEVRMNKRKLQKILICFSSLIFLCCKKSIKESNLTNKESVITQNNFLTTEQEKIDKEKLPIILQEKKEETDNSEDITIFKCWINSTEGLRSFSNLDSNIITVIPDNEEVDVLEIGQLDTIDNKLAFWLRIKYGSNIGWIFSAYINIIPQNYKTIQTEVDLPLSYENLIGNWFNGYTEIPLYLDQASFYITYTDDNFYKCGKNFTGIGVTGNYSLINDKIQLKYTITEDPEQIEYEEEHTIIKLTETTLIYNKNDESNTEDIEVHRYPKQVLKLCDESDSDWIKYINHYGNQEFYNGTDLFMYSIVNHKYTVALLLYNSEFRINKSPNRNFTYSDLFATEQNMKVRETEIYKYLLNEISQIESID